MATMARLAHARAYLKDVGLTLVVGGVVAGLALVPPPRAWADDGPIATRCSPAHAQYSHDQWQYAEFSLCAEKVGSKITYRVKVTELQYYWGSHWYYNKYRSSLKANLVVHRDGRTVTSSVSAGATPGGKTLRSNGRFEAPVPGVYSLIAQAEIGGVYWSPYVDSQVLSQPFRLELVVA